MVWRNIQEHLPSSTPSGGQPLLFASGSLYHHNIDQVGAVGRGEMMCVAVLVRRYNSTRIIGYTSCLLAWVLLHELKSVQTRHFCVFLPPLLADAMWFLHHYTLFTIAACVIGLRSSA